MSKFKQKIHEVLDVPGSGKLNGIIGTFIVTLIVLNVIAIILETVKDISLNYSIFFRYFEVFSVVVFSIEYIFRIYSITQNPKYSSPISGRIRFAFTPMALIDILAILPFYLPLLLPTNLIFLRGLRLFRLFRIFKLGRYSDAFVTMKKIFTKRKEELMVTGFIVALLFVLSSCIMYFVENGAQPNVFSSIPATMWWCIATLSTVGYGDMYPITILGKIFGGITALLGIGLFALPAGILGSGFVEEIQLKKIKKACPHCGKPITD